MNTENKGELRLKRRLNYFYQILGQLRVANSFKIDMLRAPLQEITFGLLIIGFIIFEPLGLVAIFDRIFRFK